MIDKTNWIISEYIHPLEVDKLKQRVLNIKTNRKECGKSIDLSTMTHIVRCIGGKLVKKGLLAECEINNLTYFDIEYLME